MRKILFFLIFILATAAGGLYYYMEEIFPGDFERIVRQQLANEGGNFSGTVETVSVVDYGTQIELSSIQISSADGLTEASINHVVIDNSYERLGVFVLSTIKQQPAYVLQSIALQQLSVSQVTLEGTKRTVTIESVASAEVDITDLIEWVRSGTMSDDQGRTERAAQVSLVSADLQGVALAGSEGSEEMGGIASIAIKDVRNNIAASVDLEGLDYQNFNRNFSALSAEASDFNLMSLLARQVADEDTSFFAHDLVVSEFLFFDSIQLSSLFVHFMDLMEI